MPFPIVEVDPSRADATEHLGTKSKYWYLDADGSRRLFKAEDRGTGEDWAEKMSCELARLLGLPHVNYELAIETNTNQRGVVCASCAPPPWSLVLGNQLLLARDPSYPVDGERYRVRAHTVDAVSDAVAALALPPPPWGDGLPDGIETALDVFVGSVMLDLWIANQDRHHENWGAVAANDATHLAPTFDHGAALARNLTDDDREKRLTTRDKRRGVPAFARRAQSAFYAAPASAKPLTTIDAWRVFEAKAPQAAVVWGNRLRAIDEGALDRGIG